MMLSSSLLDGFLFLGTASIGVRQNLSDNDNILFLSSFVKLYLLVLHSTIHVCLSPPHIAIRSAPLLAAPRTTKAPFFCKSLRTKRSHADPLAFVFIFLLFFLLSTLY